MFSKRQNSLGSSILGHRDQALIHGAEESKHQYSDYMRFVQFFRIKDIAYKIFLSCAMTKRRIVGKQRPQLTLRNAIKSSEVQLRAGHDYSRLLRIGDLMMASRP